METVRRPIGTEKKLARKFLAILKSWNASTVEESNHSPLSFAYALAELLCAERMPRLRAKAPLAKFRSKAFRGGRDFVRYNFEFEANLWEYALLMHRDSLAKTLQSLSNFQLGTTDGSLPDTIASQRKAVILDYEAALKTADDNLQAFYTIEYRGISHRATMDALGVAEQSESVGQLTFLAFLFIPLSFVASLFGMNLQILNSGSASIRSFTLASIGTMMTVVTLLCIAPLLSRTAHALRRNLDGLRFRGPEIRKMATITPVGAFWLLIYGLTHDPELFTPLIRELGIWGILGLHKDWEQPDILTSRRTMPLSSFWEKKIMPIADITKHRGWHETTFWQRWRDRRALTMAAAGPHRADE